jgi:GNAT superfamily N-acetyltransferase
MLRAADEADPGPEKLESVEIAYLAAQYHPADGGGADGFRYLGPAAMLGTNRFDILAFNRVVGLGIGEVQFSAAQMEEIKVFYRDQGVPRFFVQVPPSERSGSVGDLLEDSGGRHYNDWVKLVRPADAPLRKAVSGLEVLPFGPERASEYARLMELGFGWPEGAGRFFANVVGRPGYRHYFALHRGVLVAAAALYTDGELAAMAGAATLPEFRNQGAQNLLLEVRLAAARQSGCRWMVAETARELPGKPVPSFRNMLRNGFRVAYYRPNYLFELNG